MVVSRPCGVNVEGFSRGKARQSSQRLKYKEISVTVESLYKIVEDFHLARPVTAATFPKIPLSRVDVATSKISSA